MKNVIFHPSKIWRCIVVLMLIVLIDVVALEIAVLLGCNEQRNHYSECFLMFGFMAASSIIYYKMNNSKLTLSLVVGDVHVKESVINFLLFLLFASSTVLLNPQNRGELIADATIIDYVVLLLFYLFAAVGEEILFRGVFINGLRQTYRNKWFVILVVSIIFGLAHADTPYHIFSASMSSVLLGMVYYKTNSLILCVLMHFTGDLLMNFVFGWYGSGHYLWGAVLLALSLIGYCEMELTLLRKVLIGLRKVFMKKVTAIILVMSQMTILGVAQTPKDSCSIPKDSLCQEAFAKSDTVNHSLDKLFLFKTGITNKREDNSNLPKITLPKHDINREKFKNLQLINVIGSHLSR